MPPDPNSVRQQTRGMLQRERQRFKISRLSAAATASQSQASVASPALRSKGVAQATAPLQTRVQEGQGPLNLALPKPFSREPASVRPKEVGYQGRQPPVAHSQEQKFASPPQTFVQSDFGYPPNFIGHSSSVSNFGGPSTLPPYSQLVQHLGQQPGASKMTPAAVLPAAPAPSVLDPRRLQLDALRQQELEKVEQAKKVAEEAEVRIRRLTAELAQTTLTPPTPLLATNQLSDLPFCNPHAEFAAGCLWQATSTISSSLAPDELGP